jgi:Dolichyl-phosphate-mannose-protein mannosyltransferase
MAVGARISGPTLAAILIAAISVAVTLHLIDYPLGAAWDEAVKLRGVSTGRWGYYHPLFMIDLAQGAAVVVQPPDLSSLAQLIRIISALAGGVMVFATFMLARLVLPALPSLATAAATAATPLFIVHARIFKEDIFVATFLLLALVALIRLLQEPAPYRAILLGLLIGCAAGSKYIGALILPFAILAIVLVPTPGPERRALRAGTVSAISIGTFLLIMLPSNLAYDRFALDAAPSGMADYYRALASHPHLDVSNGRPTMGYFNPVTRVVALDGSVDRLNTIAAAIRTAAPSLTVRLIEPPPKK